MSECLFDDKAQVKNATKSHRHAKAIKQRKKLTISTAGAAQTGLQRQTVAAASLHAALGAEGATAGQGAGERLVLHVTALTFIIALLEVLLVSREREERVRSMRKRESEKHEGNDRYHVRKKRA